MAEQTVHQPRDVALLAGLQIDARLRDWALPHAELLRRVGAADARLVRPAERSVLDGRRLRQHVSIRR